MPDMWLPYQPYQLMRMDRCIKCGCHPEKQGHKADCPNHEERR